MCFAIHLIFVDILALGAPSLEIGIEFPPIEPTE